MRIDESVLEAQKESAGGDYPDRRSQRPTTMSLAIKTSSEMQAGSAAARPEIREILRLLGGSRQDIASERLEAAVSAIISRRADTPVHDYRGGAGCQSHRTNLTGLGSPVLDQRLLREE